MESDQAALSNGFFQKLICNTASSETEPILQIVESRPIPNLNMLRLRLSDGLFTYANCLSSMEIANKLDIEGYTKAHGIIKVTEFSRSINGDKVVFMIVDCECVKLTKMIVGEPMPHSGNPDEYRGIENFIVALQPSQKSQSQHSEQFAARKRAIAADKPVVPIKRRYLPDLIQVSAVNPEEKSFRLCGAVSMKETPRTINTKRGQSTVFSFVLTDTDGDSIKITAFGKECERISDFVKNGEAYYVLCSGDKILRETNKRFNSTGHAYEITLNSQCDVESCNDRDIGTPTIKLKAVPLADIKNYPDECVDVLAIVEKVDEAESITARTTQKQLERRNVTLIDQSLTQVKITLWNTDVEKINEEHIDQVIGIKGALVHEYNGKFSLKLSNSTLISHSPDGEDAKELYRWYIEERSDIPVAGSKKVSANSSDKGVRVIHSLHKVNMDKVTRGIYASVHAFVNTIKTENVTYMACPLDKCKKKVTEEDGKWRCSDCGLFGTYKYLYLLNIEIADFSGFAWITMFDETASTFFGMSAEKLMELQESDPIAYEEVLEKNLYQTFEFRVRITSESYEGQKRNRWNCSAVYPINFANYEAILKKELNRAL